jgi:hypothetical protein
LALFRSVRLPSRQTWGQLDQTLLVPVPVTHLTVLIVDTYHYQYGYACYRIHS